MDVYEAIAVRRSCRSYDMAHLPVGVLNDVRALLDDVSTIDPDPGIGLHLVEDGGAMAKRMPGLVGAYKKVWAPHYLVATGPRSEAACENVGYALEGVVLRLTTWRLGTCWLGGSARGEGFRRMIAFPDDHVPLMVVSFGTPAEPEGHVRAPGTSNRKPAEEIRLGGAGRWAHEIEAARLAPSAVNLQPWRFLAEDDRLDAYLRFKPPLHMRLVGEHLRLMSHTDVGIALAHVRIAAEHEGRPVKVERLRDAAERPGLRYVASAVRSGVGS